MNIYKLKLVNQGYHGVEISYNQIIKGEKLSTKDANTKKRRTPINTSMRVILDKLKYAYLNCSGHWMQPFNAYFNLEEYELMPIPMAGEMKPGQKMLRDLWNKVNITEVELTGAGFKMKADCEFVSNKPKNYAIGPIDDEDDFGFFHDTNELISELMEETENYITSFALPAPDAKKYLEQTSSLTVDEIEDLSEDERMDMAISLLEKNGAVILFDEDSQPAITDGKSDEGEVKIVQTNGNGIDSKHIDDKKDNFNEVEEESVTEEKTEGDSLGKGNEENSSGNNNGGNESGTEQAGGGAISDEGNETAPPANSEADNPKPTNSVEEEIIPIVEKVDPFGPPASEDTAFPIEHGEQASPELPSEQDFAAEPVIQESGSSDLENEIDNW